MRIRTTGDYEYRESTIEAVADHYGCNKTRALMLAADQVPELHEAIYDVLLMDSLSAKQRKEIAERFAAARGIDVETELTTTFEINE